MAFNDAFQHSYNISHQNNVVQGSEMSIFHHKNWVNGLAYKKKNTKITKIKQLFFSKQELQNAGFFLQDIYWYVRINSAKVSF